MHCYVTSISSWIIGLNNLNSSFNSISCGFVGQGYYCVCPSILKVFQCLYKKWRSLKFSFEIFVWCIQIFPHILPQTACVLSTILDVIRWTLWKKADHGHWSGNKLPFVDRWPIEPWMFPHTDVNVEKH